MDSGYAIDVDARGNPAARNLREAHVSDSYPVADLAATVARLTRFAEADPAVAGFDGVIVHVGDARFRALDFRVERLAGAAGQAVVVRPAR